MSVDLATLALAVDSTQVKTGVGELDSLTAAGTRAEAAVDRLGDTSAQAGAQIKTASQAASDMAAGARASAASATDMATNVGRAGTASGLARHQVQNLTFQANDLFVGLASGQHPMIVFIQQGSQIAQIMSQAGIGVGDLVREIKGLAVNFAKAHPGMVALAIAAGIATLTFKAFSEEITSQNKAALDSYARSLGLTKDRIRELGGAAVTTMDLIKGLGMTIEESLGFKLGDMVSETFKGIMEETRKSAVETAHEAAVIYAAFVGTYRGIAIIWKALPAVIGEAAVGAANLAIRGIEFLVNKAVAALNLLIIPVNAMLSAIGLSAIKPFTDVALPRLENAFAGAGRDAGSAFTSGFSEAYSEANDAMLAKIDQFFGKVEGNAVKAAKARLKAGVDPDKDAAKAHKDKAKALTDEEKAYLAAVKAARQYLAELEDETAKIGKTATEIKMMEVYAAAAKAPTAELALAITKAGDAWLEATKKQNAADFIKNIVEPMEFENDLIGKSIAQQGLLRAEREATAAGIARGSAEWERYIAATEVVIAREEALASSDALIENLRLISDEAQVAGEALASAFGKAGSVLGGLLESMATYQEARASLAAEVAAGTRTQTQADKALATLQARNTAAAISGFKSLFKEHSAGYKVMQAVEMAYAAVQLANSIKAIAPAVAAGAAKMFEQLGVFAFPAVAAMIAVMAGLGFSGGKSSQAAPTSPEDLQASAGTGSVLGDATAKSESIANALEIVATNSNRDLEYSTQMVRSLRNIETGIGSLASALAKSLGLSGGAFDTSGFGLGAKTGISGFGFGTLSTPVLKLLSKIPVIGGLVNALFGTKTTTTLLDQGLKFDPQTISEIVNGGINGSVYSDIETKKKKKFFGISTGTRYSYSTQTSDLDASMENQISLLIGSLRTSIIEASGILGIEGAGAVLDAFTINIGKISLKDLTGAEIREQLEAVFSKIGDDMAAAAIPGIDAFQKVGEGLFETLARLARDYLTIDTALKSIGLTFGAVGASSVAAREELIGLFASLDDFAEQTSFFRDNFLSEAERIAPVASAVREEMDRLGLSGVATREQFKAAVLGLDLTTTAGREMYAALLAVAPAFDKVAKYAEAANKTMADAFRNTVNEFEGYAASLTKYRDSLRAGELGRGNAYATSRQAFLATAALAGEGNATGLAGLEGAGKTFLDASKANASTLTQYLRDVAMVANAVDKGIFAATETADYAQLQLDALENSASILASIDTGIANVQTLLGGNPAAPAAVNTPAPVTSDGSTNDAIVVQLQAMQAENVRLQMQIAENTSQLARLWSRYDGDGLLIRTDTDTPIQVETV